MTIASGIELLLKITRLDKANIVNSHLIFFDLAFLLV
jgi:hypothetical protein